MRRGARRREPQLAVRARRYAESIPTRFPPPVFSSPREIAEGRKAGAADYIVKPFAPDHVLARASQILCLPG